MIERDIISKTDFQIRYTTAFDTPYLKKWLRIPGMLHWFYVNSDEEVDDFVKVWMSFHRLKCSLTATYQGSPCGIATLFLMPYQKVSHQAQGFVIVDPLLHRRGIGAALVKNLSHLAKEYFSLEKVHYEVYGDNPFIELLKKQEFYEVFKQQRFVKLEEKRYLARTVMERDLRKKAKHD